MVLLQFTVARAGPSRTVRSSSCGKLDENTLKFESRFESGNLAKAVQVYAMRIDKYFYILRMFKGFYNYVLTLADFMS